MSDRIELPAPAKLNLFLHITGRREDGYHNLQTLFQFIDFQDSLQIQVTRRTDVELCCNWTGIAPQDNLIFRAAHLLRSHTGCDLGARIHLNKQLPAGAGLGGGSSDAASTLLALNRLWRVNLSTEKLAQLGLQLGADVPVFIHGHAALATGIGEELTPFHPPEDWHLLLMPACHVTTAQLFADKHLTRNSLPITIRAISQGEGHNDFEPVARRLFPLVEKGFEILAQWGNPRLTGTGACLYNSYAEPEHARTALQEVQHYLNTLSLASEFTVRLAKGLNRSPAVAALNRAFNKT